MLYIICGRERARTSKNYHTTVHCILLLHSFKDRRTLERVQYVVRCNVRKSTVLYYVLYDTYEAEVRKSGRGGVPSAMQIHDPEVLG